MVSSVRAATPTPEKVVLDSLSVREARGATDPVLVMLLQQMGDRTARLEGALDRVLTQLEVRVGVCEGVALVVWSADSKRVWVCEGWTESADK